MKAIELKAIIVTMMCCIAMIPALAQAQELNRVSHVDYEAKGVVLDLREQLRNLLGNVSSVEARASAIEASIVSVQKRLDALELQLDNNGADVEELNRRIAINDKMLSALYSERDTIAEELKIKQYISTGACPVDMKLVASDRNGVTCESPQGGVLMSSLSSGLETLMTSRMAIIPPSGRTTVTITCASGYVAVSPGHYLTAANVLLEQTRQDGVDNSSWIFRFANWDTMTRFAAAYLSCMRVAP